MLKSLNWDNYLILVDLVNKNHYNEWFSITTLLTWNYYGIELKYNIIKNVIFFYIRFTKGYFHNEKINSNQWMCFACYYNDSTNRDWFLNQIEVDLKSLGTDVISFNNIPLEMVEFLQLDKSKLIQEEYISNYIYYISDLKTFKGKQLQKKRNHLNYFLKQNHQIEIKDIHTVNKRDILEFINHHILTTSDNYRLNEYQICEQLILNEIDRDQRYSGICIYINNQLEALTLGFENNNIYDVLIEKANHEIRGLYPFLIKTNLEYNHINCLYMDREDDAFDLNLAKSKDSYQPIYKIKRYSYFG